MIVYLNNTAIAGEDVIGVPLPDTEELKFNGNALCASTVDVVLNNIEYAYDANVEGGLLYGVDWYNMPLDIFDEVNGRYIFKGRLKNYILDYGKGIATFTATNVVQDLADTSCVYSGSALTPAAMAYAIISTVATGIPAENVNKASFDYYGALQTGQGQALTAIVTAEQNLNCLNVLEDLCRMSLSYIYPVDNVLYYYQEAPYSGTRGYSITDSDVVAGSISLTNDVSKLINAWNIRYISGANAASESGEADDSIAKYGMKKALIVPESDQGTLAANYSLIHTTAASAIVIGDLVLSLYKEIPKVLKFTVLSVSMHYPSLEILDTVDIRFYPFVFSPGRVIGIKRNYEKDTAELTIQLLNDPIEHVSLNTTVPQSLVLTGIIPIPGGVYLRYSKSVDPDFFTYLLFFSESLGEWFISLAKEGLSPIISAANTPDHTGDIGSYLHHPVDYPYEYKVRAINSSGTESEDSNILEYIPPAVVINNQYRTLGDFGAGTSLDINNTGGGTVPDRFATYVDLDDAFEYPYVITAYYEAEFQSLTEIQSATFITNGNVKIQWRASDDGATWTDWSDELEGNVEIAPGALYLQIGVIYRSEFYSDADYAIMTSLIH